MLLLMPSLQPTAHYTPQSDQLLLQTNLFVASQAYSHGSYLPDLRLSQPTVFSIQNLSLYSIGLPLLLAALCWLWFAKIKARLVGGLTLLLMVVATAWVVSIKLSYKILLYLSQPAHHRSLTAEGYVNHVLNTPDWVLILLKPTVDSLDMINIVVLPIVLVAWVVKRRLTMPKSAPAPDHQTSLN